MIKRILVVIFVRESEESFPLADAEQQPRAVLSKLRDHCVSLEALDKQGTFNMAMETDDDSSLDPDVRRQWDDMPNNYT